MPCLIMYMMGNSEFTLYLYFLTAKLFQQYLHETLKLCILASETMPRHCCAVACGRRESHASTSRLLRSSISSRTGQLAKTRHSTAYRSDSCIQMCWVCTAVWLGLNMLSAAKAPDPAERPIFPSTFQSNKCASCTDWRYPPRAS